MTLKTTKTRCGDIIRLTKSKKDGYVVTTNDGIYKKKNIFNDYATAYAFYKDMVMFYK